MEPLLDTAAAAQRLTDLGVHRAPTTLRKLRCTGDGPAYRILNGKPYYTERDLVAWIESRLSPPQEAKVNWREEFCRLFEAIGLTPAPAPEDALALYHSAVSDIMAEGEPSQRVVLGDEVRR